MTKDQKPTLLLAPKDSISVTDKARLSNAGYIVIEVDDPEKVKTVADLGMISTDMIANAAIEAVHHANTGTTTKERFAQMLLNKVVAKIISDQK